MFIKLIMSPTCSLSYCMCFCRSEIVFVLPFSTFPSFQPYTRHPNWVFGVMVCLTPGSFFPLFYSLDSKLLPSLPMHWSRREEEWIIQKQSLSELRILFLLWWYSMLARAFTSSNLSPKVNEWSAHFIPEAITFIPQKKKQVSKTVSTAIWTALLK